jgi:hypothetical protein
MKIVLAIALFTGAAMTGPIAATSAAAQSLPTAAQLADQLDQNGVASTHVRRGGGGRGGGGFRGGHVGGGRVGGIHGGRVGSGGRYGYGYGRRGWGTGAAVAGGLAAGALVGGAVAGSQYYYGDGYGAAPAYAEPEQTGSVDNTAYCMQRFRSYDQGSGTYLGYDGQRHPCP